VVHLAKSTNGRSPLPKFKTPTNSQFLILVSLVFVSLAALSAIGYETFWGGTQHLLVSIMFAIFAVYAHQSEKN